MVIYEMYIEKEKYKNLLKTKIDQKVLWKNVLVSFIAGGLLCLFGELLIMLYQKAGLDETKSRTLMSITVVLIAAILSALGVYDRVGQIAKAGVLVPISGFANGAVSAAMEFKSEGFLLGLSANVFKVVGSVIVLGVFFGYFVGLMKYLWSLIWAK